MKFLKLWTSCRVYLGVGKNLKLLTNGKYFMRLFVIFSMTGLSWMI